MLVGKYILVIFHSLYVIRNIRGTCSSIKMLKGYITRESLITPVLNLNPVPSPRERFGGLSHPNKAPDPPKLKHETL